MIGMFYLEYFNADLHQVFVKKKSRKSFSLHKHQWVNDKYQWREVH